VQWPVEEIETLRTILPGAAEVVASGGVREIDGIVSSQADVDVVFEVPDLDAAEEDIGFDPKRLLDPDALCREKSASVRGGVAGDGLRRPARAHRRVLQGVEAPARARRPHVHGPNKVLLGFDYLWASSGFDVGHRRDCAKIHDSL
jgi:hypothetical protein